MSDTGETGRESAERRLAVIYGELRALVQPVGTWNDAPLARREELESEAADLRRQWDLSDPRDLRRDPPGRITKLLRRQRLYSAGPPFTMALILAVLWLALGLVWLVNAIRDPGVTNVLLAVGGLVLAGAWVTIVIGAMVHRRNHRRASDETASSGQMRDR